MYSHFIIPYDNPSSLSRKHETCQLDYFDVATIEKCGGALCRGQVNKILHQGCSPWWRKKTPLAFLPLENENFKRQTLISSTEFVSHFLEDIRNIKNTLPRGMKYLWQRRKTNVFSHNSGILLLVFIQQQTLLDEEHLLGN